MRFLRLPILLLALATASFVSRSVLAAEPAAEKAAVKNISVDEAEKRIAKHKEIIVLDVRTPKEVAAGHIAGSRAINFYDADFKDQVARLDKSRIYVVFCASGGRSAKACTQMVDLGFKDVLNVEGGMRAWEKAGKKTVK